MFNRSEIMKAAWATYRASRRPWLNLGFEREEFAFHLQVAWHNAKVAAMTPTQQRIHAVERELDDLMYKPLRIDIATRRRALETELARLRYGQ
jgi:monomeric isocitrate dehydrogenase